MCMSTLREKWGTTGASDYRGSGLVAGPGMPSKSIASAFRRKRSSQPIDAPVLGVSADGPLT
jgi:hypothetical protein